MTRMCSESFRVDCRSSLQVSGTRIWTRLLPQCWRQSGRAGYGNFYWTSAAALRVILPWQGQVWRWGGLGRRPGRVSGWWQLSVVYSRKSVPWTRKCFVPDRFRDCFDQQAAGKPFNWKTKSSFAAQLSTPLGNCCCSGYLLPSNKMETLSWSRIMHLCIRLALIKLQYLHLHYSSATLFCIISSLF